MDRGAEVLWLVMAFTLVASALIARQLKWTEWVKMALAWAAIFALLFLVIRTWQMVT